MSIAPASTVEYRTLLERSADSRSTVALYGVIAKAPSHGVAGPRGCIPILWCYCVHDSPDSPCPCRGPIIWLPEKEIFRIGETKRSGDAKGKTLVQVEVASDARLFVDETRKIAPKRSGGAKLLRASANGDLSPVEETLWIQEFSGIRAAALVRALEVVESNPRLQAIAKKKGGGFWGSIVAAFQAGWEIGAFIDEKTGASDALADWLYDTLGPFDELF